MLILQDVTTVTQVTDVIEQAAEPQHLNFIDMAFKGGWIMLPLALLLIFAIYIFIVLLITFLNT